MEPFERTLSSPQCASWADSFFLFLILIMRASVLSHTGVPGAVTFNRAGEKNPIDVFKISCVLLIRDNIFLGVRSLMRGLF